MAHLQLTAGGRQPESLHHQVMVHSNNIVFKRFIVPHVKMMVGQKLCRIMLFFFFSRPPNVVDQLRHAWSLKFASLVLH